MRPSCFVLMLELLALAADPAVNELDHFSKTRCEVKRSDASALLVTRQTGRRAQGRGQFPVNQQRRDALSESAIPGQGRADRCVVISVSVVAAQQAGAYSG